MTTGQQYEGNGNKPIDDGGTDEPDMDVPDDAPQEHDHPTITVPQKHKANETNGSLVLLGAGQPYNPPYK